MSALQSSLTHLDIPGGDQVHAALLAEAHPEGEAPAPLRPPATVEGVALRRAGGHEAALRAGRVGGLAAEETRIHSLLFYKVVLDTLNLDRRYRYKIQVPYLKSHKLYL